MSDQKEKLQELREQIDALDKKLLALLNQRAILCIQIGRVKKSHFAAALEIKDHAREQYIIEKLTQQNKGPLSQEQIIVLFKKIMSQSRELQEHIS